MNTGIKNLQAHASVIFALFLSACGGGGGGGDSGTAPTPPQPPLTFAVGGTVSGLAGGGFVLRNNGGDELNISSNGPFQFATRLANGSTYNVVVQSQPNSQPLQLCTVANGASTIAGSAVTNISVNCHLPTGRFIYTADYLNDRLLGFAIDAETGALTALPGSPFANAGTRPRAFVTNANKSLLYVVGNVTTTQPYAGTLAGYSINSATGALTSLSGMPINFSAAVNRLWIHPISTDLYFHSATHTGAGALYGYHIDGATGALSPLTGSPFAVGILNGGVLDATSTFYFAAAPLLNEVIKAYRIDAMGAPQFSRQASTSSNTILTYIDPSNRFLYAINYGAFGISVFGIDSVNGLSSTTRLWSYGIQDQSNGAVFDQNSHFYVSRTSFDTNTATVGPGSVAVFSMATDGQLTAITGSPFQTQGKFPLAPIFDPSRKFLVVSNSMSENIAVFSVDATSGALSHVPGSPFPVAGQTGGGLGAVSFDPSGRFLFATSATTNLIWSYAFNATTGNLTLVNSVPSGATLTTTGTIIVGTQ